MKRGGAIDLIRKTYSEWSQDKAPRLGAALAYHAIFSIPPLVVILLGVLGLVYHGDAAGALQAQLSALAGERTAAAIMETGRQQTSGGGMLAVLVGIVLLLVGASGVFGELQDSLNTIWDVQPKEKTGILETIRNRFLSFVMVLGVAFLLLVSLVFSAAISLVSKSLPGGEAFVHILELAISFAVTTLLFALIFKVLPQARIAWRDVWIGALATAALFTIGKFAIGLYLGKATIGSTYGAAGGVVVIIVWVYYSAQLLFFGAEFTQVYARRHQRAT